MAETRIALYVGNELYPGNDPLTTVEILQGSPLTSPILSLLNWSAQNLDLLVYNDASNPVFDNTGAYVGSKEWPEVISRLRNGGSIQELYLSFSTNGTEFMGDLLAKNDSAAAKILATIRKFGFDGIDLDYEAGLTPSAPIYPLADAAIAAGLKLTAAPFTDLDGWQKWVRHVQGQGGTVSWLNLQCYAGGKGNNPGDWLGLGVPIVAGSCSNCGFPQTTCSPSDMEALFTLWRTGKGSVSPACWSGVPNTGPQAIGGGFIWAYSSIVKSYSAYIDAVAAGLGF